MDPHPGGKTFELLKVAGIGEEDDSDYDSQASELYPDGQAKKLTDEEIINSIMSDCRHDPNAVVGGERGRASDEVQHSNAIPVSLGRVSINAPG